MSEKFIRKITMNPSSESLLQIISRLPRHQVVCDDHPKNQLDAPIVNYPGVTIIDWTQSHSNAVNHYMYRLCKLVLNKRTLELVTGEDGNQDPCGSTPADHYNKAAIVILDGLGSFNLIHLSDLLASRDSLKELSFVQEVDPYRFIMTIRRYLIEILAFNSKLDLIIIYVAISSLDHITSILSREKITTNIILITSEMPSINHNIRKNENCHILHIKSESGGVEIKKFSSKSQKPILTIKAKFSDKDLNFN